MVRNLALIACLFACALVSADPSWVLLEEATSKTGWKLNAGREFPGAQGEVSLGTAPDGTTALQCDVDFTKGGNYAGPERSVRITDGTRVRFRVWGEGVKVLMVRMRDLKKQEHAGSVRFEPGSWQTVELSLDEEGFKGHWSGPNDGKFYFPIRRILLAANSMKGRSGRLWIRDIEIQTDDASLFWGIVVRSDQPGNIFFRDEQPAKPAIELHNRVAAPASVVADWKVVDQTGATVVAKKQPLSFAKWERKTIVPDLPTLDYGHYLVSVVLRADGKVVGVGEGAFGVVEKLPNYGPEQDPESFFGLHVNDAPAAARIGVKWDRLHRDWWWAEARSKDYYWPDTVLDQGEAFGIAPMMTIAYGPPSWAKKLAGDKPQWPPPPEMLDAWEDFVKVCVRRYEGRVACWEIQNEPDLTCYYHRKLTMDVGIQSYVSIVRRTHKAIREAGSKLPISGVDVSGGDYRNNLKFSRGTLREVGDLIDIYTGHPYASPRYFGEGLSPLFPKNNRLVEKIELSKSMLRELGGERPIWIGEKGWGLDIDEPITGTHSMAYADCVAQALATGRSVPGVQRWFWFLQNGCNERGHEYGLWRGSPAQPLPAAVAYATSARFLYHVEPARSLKLPAAVEGAGFVCKDLDRAVVALWTMSDETVIRSNWPAGTKAYTMYGREADVNQIVLTRAPCYLTAPLHEADALFAKVEEGHARPRVPVRIEAVHLARIDAVNARVRNLTDESVLVELRAAGQTKTVDLPAKAKENVIVTLPAGGGKIEVEVLEDGQRVFTKTVSRDVVTCPSRSPEIDGDLSEWGKPQIVLEDRGDVLPPDPGIGWDGPEDLSVQAWLGWNAHGLLFAARVKDDIHDTKDNTASRFWRSDSIQLAVDPLNDAGDEPKFDANDREFGFIAAGPNGKAFETVPKTRDLRIPCVAKRQGTDTTYEVLIPWSKLGVRPEKGRVLSLNFIVNDNDGNGRAYWIGARPGIGEAKRPGVYLDVALAE